MNKEKEKFDQAVKKHAEIANAQELVTMKAPKGGNKYHKDGETLKVTKKVAETLKDKQYTEVK